MNTFKRQWGLQVFVLTGMMFLLVFNIVPMFGILMAFKNYKINQGVMGIFTSEWVGLKYFREFVTDYEFGKLMRNTLLLSFQKMIFTFPAPIIFAIMLNEIRRPAFKRIVQTASYLPNFISWVIVAGILQTFFATDTGALNTLLVQSGILQKPIPILSSAKYFRTMAVMSSVWKETGWWAILYLAAIAGIDPTLYEAAEIDGASRLQKIWHITMSGIRPTVSVVLVMALGNLLGGGIGGSNFDQCYLLGNALNEEASKIIQTYSFEIGLAKGRYSYAAAVGLFQSCISLLLVLISNTASKKITGSGLY